MLSALSNAARSTLLHQQSLLKGALVEELTEKLAFWDHVPYKALGVFWCCQGGTLAESKKVYAECISEYDSVVASGKANALHRVAHIIFSKGQVCRAELDQWCEAADAPLDQFPTAFSTLQEYSLCSLVERRVEQIHALIKRLGKGATYIFAPYLCAKLREPMHLQLLRRSNEFYSFCVGNWRKRRLLDLLLVSRKTPAQLKAMSNKAKVDALYQCSLEEEFQSTLAARCYQDIWKKQLCLEGPEKLSLQEKALADYWKATWITDGIYSLPRKLFDQAVSGIESHDQDQCCSITDVLGVVDGPLQQATGAADTYCLFRVTNLHPERRYKVPLPHLEQKRTTVNVCLLDIVSSNPANSCDIVLRADGDAHQTLDMAHLAKSMDEALQTCFRWEMTKEMTSWKLMGAPAILDTADDTPLDCISSSSRGLASTLALASRKDELVSSCKRDSFAHSMLKELMARKAFRHQPALVDSLHCWREQTLQDLQELCVINLSHDELGRTLVSVEPSRLRFGVFIRVGSPVQHVRLSLHYQPPLKRSKLDIIFALHADGWMPGSDQQEFTMGSPKLYRSGLQQPLSYFACLLEHRAVCEKGVPIKHGGLDAYYKCLLKMQPEQLQAVIRDMENQQNTWFESKLKQLAGDNDDDDVVQALEHPGPSVASECVVASDVQASDFDPTSTLTTAVQRTGYTRQLVDVVGADTHIKVYFDNFSASLGGSSDQRGFCNCSSHNCIRYRAVGGDSLQEYCARAWLWHLQTADCPTKQIHLEWEPSEEAVQAVLPRLRLRSF